ncbi:hypothetical protein ANTRET_LOCUS3630 [Anthophora retusa]
MDNNENAYVEQNDRSEESRPDTLDDGEKIQQPKNEEKKNEAEIGRRKSNDSVENGGGSRNFTGDQQYRRESQQSGNYGKMCEHSRDVSYQGNFSDGSPGNFDAENIWQQRDTEFSYDNYGNDGNGFIVNHSNDPHRNCKSGINVSLVSRKELPCENVEIEKPICNVSFKRCYENAPKCDNKRKKFFPSSRCIFKKSNKEDANRPDCASNFRCTFENCCGNCESYIMEVPNNDCTAYKNWQNNNFESRNLCFEDCCCPREMKVYSSNLSVRPQRSCGACVENRDCCFSSNEPKIDFCDRPASSKHFLQRVHFAKKKNCAEKKHSSCSFCSRKCTPSKASLFVEIGESMADVCNLASGQVFHCDDPIESVKDDCGRKNHCFLKRNKSDMLKSRGKKKHSDSAKCNSNCKGRPGAVMRCNSDRIAFMETCADDGVIEQTVQEACCPEMLGRSSVCFQEVQDCRSQTESNMYLIGATIDCKQQCDTGERSLLDDIRKGRLWTQLQDTYKTLVKAATTSICQIMKQSSKFKRSKKCDKDCLTRATCTKEREKSMCADQCNQSEVYECLYEGTCWKKIMEQESNNCDIHCCRNVCCENVAGLSECQKPPCQRSSLLDVHWKHNRKHQKQSRKQREWHCDPRNNHHRNVYPFNEGPVKDSRCPRYKVTRKRGGGDFSNQKRRQLNMNRNQSSSNGEQSSSSSNSNPKNEVMKQPMSQNEQQTERATMHIDVTVQASAIRAVVDPSNSPFITESLSYQKRIKTIKRMETYSDALPDSSYNKRDVSTAKESGTVIQEVDSSVQSLPAQREEAKSSKKQVGPATKRTVTPSSTPTKPGASSPRTSASRSLKSDNAKSVSSTQRKASLQKDKSVTKPEKTNSKLAMPTKEVQCAIISKEHVICGSKDALIQVENLCYCGITKGTSPEAKKTEEKKDESAGTSEDPEVEGVGTSEDSPVEDQPAEDTPTEPIIEQPEEQPVEKTTPPVLEVEITPVESKMEQVPEEKEPDVVDLTESTSKEKEPAKEPSVEPTKETISPFKEITPATPDRFGSTLTPVTDRRASVSDPSAPIEFSREFNGKRTYVSVQMQTSSTILTQILSEFKEGNKKRQVLMSIRLQSNLDGQPQPSGSSDDGVSS